MANQIRRVSKAMLLALPLAFGWTIYTSQPTPGNFLLGYLFSVAVVMATGLRGESMRLRNAFRQIYSLLAYVAFLAYEVLISGMNVARVVLGPTLKIDPGFTLVNTGDKREDELVSAMSAHGITITPGELVVDFQESQEDGVMMIVHSLNKPDSAESLDREQAIRLKRIRGILGHD